MDIELPFDQIAGFFEEDFKRINKELLDNLKDEIVMKTPVDSGNLRAGWKINGDELVNDVPYAGYVETGSIHNRPVGMVATTLLNVDSILDKII